MKTKPQFETIIFDFARVLLLPKDTSLSGSFTQAVADNPGVLRQLFLNQELLDWIETIKPSYTTAILTASNLIMTQDAIRSQLEPYFQDIFLSKDFETSKDQAATYLQVCQQLGTEPAAALFIDDNHRNVAAAETAGLTAIQYTSNQQLFSHLAKLGFKNPSQN